MIATSADRALPGDTKECENNEGPHASDLTSSGARTFRRDLYESLAAHAANDSKSQRASTHQHPHPRGALDRYIATASLAGSPSAGSASALGSG